MSPHGVTFLIKHHWLADPDDQPASDVKSVTIRQPSRCQTPVKNKLNCKDYSSSSQCIACLTAFLQPL